MPSTKIVTGAAAVLAAVALVGTGAALSNAATGAATPNPSATSSPSSPSDKDGQRGGHEHTAVTGSEAEKVTAAVKAKDSAVTVTAVEKDPDGSYDVDATKAGATIRYDVSTDLKTITARTGDGGRDHGGRGNHTPVTGAEADKVSAAVKSKDSTVTVTSVQKDEDGSYDVDATKAGATIRYDVSSDLKTITTREGH